MIRSLPGYPPARSAQNNGNVGVSGYAGIDASEWEYLRCRFPPNRSVLLVRPYKQCIGNGASVKLMSDVPDPLQTGGYRTAQHSGRVNRDRNDRGVPRGQPKLGVTVIVSEAGCYRCWLR